MSPACSQRVEKWLINQTGQQCRREHWRRQTEASSDTIVGIDEQLLETESQASKKLAATNLPRFISPVV